MLESHCKEGKGEGWADRLLLLFATGFGAGYSPVVPGTIGTLVAIPIYLLLSRIHPPFYELTLFTFFVLAIRASDLGERYFGKKDDRRIVIDEMAGFLVTMLWITGTLVSILLGFLLFRFFDIVKPFPIRTFERRWPGGSGVVMDDVMAGFYATIVLHLVVWIGK